MSRTPPVPKADNKGKGKAIEQPALRRYGFEQLGYLDGEVDYERHHGYETGFRLAAQELRIVQNTDRYCSLLKLYRQGYDAGEAAHRRLYRPSDLQPPPPSPGRARAFWLFGFSGTGLSTEDELRADWRKHLLSVFGKHSPTLYGHTNDWRAVWTEDYRRGRLARLADANGPPFLPISVPVPADPPLRSFLPYPVPPARRQPVRATAASALVNPTSSHMFGRLPSAQAGPSNRNISRGSSQASSNESLRNRFQLSGNSNNGHRPASSGSSQHLYGGPNSRHTSPARPSNNGARPASSESSQHLYSDPSSRRTSPARPSNNGDRRASIGSSQHLYGGPNSRHTSPARPSVSLRSASSGSQHALRNVRGRSDSPPRRAPAQAPLGVNAARASTSSPGQLGPRGTAQLQPAGGVPSAENRRSRISIIAFRERFRHARMSIRRHLKRA